MRKPKRPSLENIIYALGLAGFLLLIAGIVTHITCNGQIPCPLDRWEHFAYYAGHICMIVAAIAYCVVPFFRRES
jgi:cytochrome b561